MIEYDVIIIGAGHNGLIAACYLAKKGLKVHVLERREIIGGDTITEEVTSPGFKHNVAAHFVAQLASTNIPEELELYTKYGLKLLTPENKIFLGAFPDQTVYVQYKDLERTLREIENKFSKRDSKAYLDYYNIGKKLFEMRVGQLAPPSSPKDMAEAITGPESEDFWWLIKTNMENVLNEFFEDDKFKSYLAWFGCMKGTDPYQYGTAPFAFTPAIMHDTGFSMVKGGTGGLPIALEKCLKNNNGSDQINAEVKEIIIKNGVAKGVKLVNNKEIYAKKAIISNINIKLMIEKKILSPEHLDQDIIRKIKRLRAGYVSCISTYYDINEIPKYKSYKGIPPFEQHIQGLNIDELGDFFHGVKMGKPRTSGMPLLVNCESRLDPSLAPRGKHTLWCATFAPYELKNGKKWDDYKEEYADIMLENLQDYTENLNKSNILARHVDSPLDLERRNPNNYKGYWGMLELTPDQSDFLRPTMELSNYRTPIKNLYITGGGTFPSGGVTGAPGHNVAQIVLEDLKLI